VSQNPALARLDLKLPGMDGLEVLRQMRALVGECAWGSK
jgi:CheY-like chemotaxis protein